MGRNYYDEIEWPEDLKLAQPRHTKWNAKKQVFEGGSFEFTSRHQSYSHIEGRWKVLRAIQEGGLHNKDRNGRTRMYLTLVMRWYVLNGVSKNVETIKAHVNEYNEYCNMVGHPERQIEIVSPEWVMQRGAKSFFDRFFSRS